MPKLLRSLELWYYHLDMTRSRIIVFSGVIAATLAAAILLTGIFADFSDPAFQQALLRLLALVGLAAILAMAGSLMMHVEADDLVPARVATTRRRRK